VLIVLTTVLPVLIKLISVQLVPEKELIQPLVNVQLVNMITVTMMLNVIHVLSDVILVNTKITIVLYVPLKEMVFQNVIVLMVWLKLSMKKLEIMSVEIVTNTDVLPVMLTKTIVNSVSTQESENHFVIVHQVCTKLKTLLVCNVITNVLLVSTKLINVSLVEVIELKTLMMTSLMKKLVHVQLVNSKLTKNAVLIVTSNVLLVKILLLNVLLVMLTESIHQLVTVHLELSKLHMITVLLKKKSVHHVILHVLPVLETLIDVPLVKLI
jgi:hypothetical protein